MDDTREFFQSVTGHSPYEFQAAAMEVLRACRPLVMVAPTGSGKTEAVVTPFLRMSDIPHMFYSLPTRSLANDIFDRVRQYAGKRGDQAALCHGGVSRDARTPIPEFRERVIVATIDQTVGAYLASPLSFPYKLGNVYAGAAAAAALVFDEVHTLHPEKGLQTAMVLGRDAARLGLPVAMISATLPTKVARSIAERIGGSEPFIVDDDSKIPSRRNRDVEVRWDREPISAGVVLDLMALTEGGGAIVVMNTVERAQTLYRELLGHRDRPGCVLLAHSRFTESDRASVEGKIGAFFGKNSDSTGTVLVSTQVVEVGMNISAPLVISEEAPVDALVQRAGRCARWGGKGLFSVHPTGDTAGFAPYSEPLVRRSSEAVRASSGRQLDWPTERGWVDDVLTEPYSSFLKPEIMYRTMGILARAQYEGRRADVEEAVREFASCDLTLHESPSELSAKEAFALRRVRVDAAVLRRKVQDLRLEAWSLVEDMIVDTDSDGYRLRKADPADIVPGRFYVIRPEGVAYDRRLGLVFGETGEGMDAQEAAPDPMKLQEHKYRDESWTDHGRRILHHFVALWPKYEAVVRSIASATGVAPLELKRLSEVCVALHDLGKLNRTWQRRIGRTQAPWLAHASVEKERALRLPAHATVTAVALAPLFGRMLEAGTIPEAIYQAFLMACAHHHSPRAAKFPEFEFVQGWQDAVADVIRVDPEDIKFRRDSAGEIPWRMIDFARDAIAYRFYAVVSRMLRLSDWAAATEVSIGG